MRLIKFHLWLNCSFNKAPNIFKCMWTSIAYNYELTILALCSAGASGLHLTKHENFHGGLDAISVGDGLFTILTTLSKRATSVQVMLQPILTYMACGYMGRQVSFILLGSGLWSSEQIQSSADAYLFIYLFIFLHLVIAHSLGIALHLSTVRASSVVHTSSVGYQWGS